MNRQTPEGLTFITCRSTKERFLPPPSPLPVFEHLSRAEGLVFRLTVHVGGLLAGEKYARVELPHKKLLLSGFKDVLDQPAVVDVGAVEADAEPLLHLHRRSCAEGFGHLPGPLTPVAGGHR